MPRIRGTLQAHWGFDDYFDELHTHIWKIMVIIAECAIDSGTPCDALNALLCVTANTSVPRAAALIVVH